MALGLTSRQEGVHILPESIKWGGLLIDGGSMVTKTVWGPKDFKIIVISCFFVNIDLRSQSQYILFTYPL